MTIISNYCVFTLVLQLNVLHYLLHVQLILLSGYSFRAVFVTVEMTSLLDTNPYSICSNQLEVRI